MNNVPRGFENRAALPQELQRAHQRAVLAELQAAGHEFKQWDRNAIIGLGTVAVSDTVTLGDVRYEPKQHEHPIAQYGTFRLHSSETPLPYLERNGIYGSDDQTYMHDVVKDVEAPAKLLRLNLQDSRATVYTSADHPPLMIHDADLSYVEEQSRTDRSQYAIIDAVQDAFGPESVHYLSEDEAAGLIEAIRTTPASATPNPLS